MIVTLGAALTRLPGATALAVAPAPAPAPVAVVAPMPAPAPVVAAPEVAVVAPPPAAAPVVAAPEVAVVAPPPVEAAPIMATPAPAPKGYVTGDGARCYPGERWVPWDSPEHAGLTDVREDRAVHAGEKRYTQSPAGFCLGVQASVKVPEQTAPATREVQSFYAPLFDARPDFYMDPNAKTVDKPIAYAQPSKTSAPLVHARPDPSWASSAGPLEPERPASPCTPEHPILTRDGMCVSREVAEEPRTVDPGRTFDPSDPFQPEIDRSPVPRTPYDPPPKESPVEEYGFAHSIPWPKTTGGGEFRETYDPPIYAPTWSTPPASSPVLPPSAPPPVAAPPPVLDVGAPAAESCPWWLWLLGGLAVGVGTQQLAKKKPKKGGR